MIAKVSHIRDLLKGLNRNQIVEISSDGITLIEIAHLNRRKVNAAKAYTLLDSGKTQVEVAKILGTTKQVINWLCSKRNEALDKSEKGEG